MFQEKVFHEFQPIGGKGANGFFNLILQKFQYFGMYDYTIQFLLLLNNKKHLVQMIKKNKCKRCFVKKKTAKITQGRSVQVGQARCATRGLNSTLFIQLGAF